MERAAAQPELWAGLRPLVKMDLLEAGVETLNLEPGQIWDLGGGARLSAPAVAGERAELLLEWENFRALLPGGLEPGLIGAALPVSVVVIGENAEGWHAGAAQAQVVCSAGVAPPGVVALPPGSWLEVTSDGEQMWLESGY